MTLNTPLTLPEPASGPAPRVKRGDYLHSRRELYRVESLDSDRAVLEQCRTNVMVEASLDRLGELKPVRPAGSRAAGRG